MQSKKELISYLDNISIFLIGILFLGFPLVITTLTTDAFILPKQIFLGVIAFLLLIIFGVKTLAEKEVKIRRTPFDIPVLLLTIVLFVSSIFAVNFAESMTSFITFLLIALLFFLVTNNIKDKKAIKFALSALLAGGAIASLISFLSYFKIYVLPFKETYIQSFTTLGSVLDLAVYLILLLPIALYPIVKVFKKKLRMDGQAIAFSVFTVLILLGLYVSIYQLMTTQKPTLLPLSTGFQTAFGAISQDNGRLAQGFFFGSGYGTYLTDFTRFKQATYNLNPNLWSFTFFKSSSFVLELLATAGILGLLAFLSLVYKIIKEKPFFTSIIIGVILLFVLPFSYFNLAIFFMILAVYAAIQGARNHNRFFDVELQLVALKKGLFTLEPTEGGHKAKNIALPISLFVVVLVFVGYIIYLSYGYITANVLFQRSFVAAANNDINQTYLNQRNALNNFQYNDAYYRTFSQTNLLIATALSQQIQPNSSPSAEVTNAILTHTQLSIDSARAAMNISPRNTLNWQNLSTIYRSLIGFGQNADQFAVYTAQQAIMLDPNNPQLYIGLGGIYYQLGQWDQAIQQFQIAANLKPDLANAYYNLGHALENKGDLKGAISQYLTVKSLVAKDKASLERVTKEIEELQKKVDVEAKGENKTSDTVQAPLDINEPTVTLPEQEPKVKIPGPTSTPTPSKSPSPTPAPSLE